MDMTTSTVSPVPSKPRVALVVPNLTWCDWDASTRWHFIPYNLCLLAAMVDDFVDVVVIDANKSLMSEEQFLHEVTACKPDVVGITVLMDQYAPAGHKAAELTKKADSKIVTVLGGVHATVNPDTVLSDPNVDFVVVGEGEYVLQDLLKHILFGAAMPARGIAFRAGGGITDRGRAPYIQDLDSLPLPAYKYIDLPAYTSGLPSRRSIETPSVLPYARIMTSRGCPYGCVFCQVESISGRKFRARSPENILREIQWLRDTYEIKALIFDDDNLFTVTTRAKAIFRGMIERGLRMPWVSISTAVFKMDTEMLALMKDSGCEHINIAIESGNERVLRDVVGKPLDLKQAKVMAKAAVEAGIFVAANFVIGFPTETWDEIRETIRYAENLDAHYVKIFVAIPLPHTRLWKLCDETGSFKKDFAYNAVRWNTGQIETKEFSARDLTILRAYEWDRINFTDAVRRRLIAARMRISEEELLAMRRGTLEKARDIGEFKRGASPGEAATPSQPQGQLPPC